MAAFVPVQVTGTFEDWGTLLISYSMGAATPPGDPYSDTSVRRYVFPDDGSPKMIGTAGAGVIFPDNVKEVVFVQDTDERFYIRIPGKTMTLQAQQDINAGADYILPQFYIDPPLNCTAPDGVEEKLKLQKERVGDYSIGYCM